MIVHTKSPCGVHTTQHCKKIEKKWFLKVRKPRIQRKIFNQFLGIQHFSNSLFSWKIVLKKDMVRVRDRHVFHVALALKESICRRVIISKVQIYD